MLISKFFLSQCITLFSSWYGYPDCFKSCGKCEDQNRVECDCIWVLVCIWVYACLLAWVLTSCSHMHAALDFLTLHFYFFFYSCLAFCLSGSVFIGTQWGSVQTEAVGYHLKTKTRSWTALRAFPGPKLITGKWAQDVYWLSYLWKLLLLCVCQILDIFYCRFPFQSITKCLDFHIYQPI